MKPWHIGEILVQKKLIDWKQLEDGLSEQAKTRELLGEVLVRKQYIPKYLLFKALAERHALPFVDLEHVFIDPAAVNRVPKSVAAKYGLIPIQVEEDALVVGISDPRQVLPEKEIAGMAGLIRLKTVLCTPEAIVAAMDQSYGGQNKEAGVPS